MRLVTLRAEPQASYHGGWGPSLNRDTLELMLNRDEVCTSCSCHTYILVLTRLVETECAEVKVKIDTLSDRDG